MGPFDTNDFFFFFYLFFQYPLPQTPTLFVIFLHPGNTNKTCHPIITFYLFKKHP